MPFYENFTMKNPTSFGTKMAAKEADNVLKAIISHRSKVDSVLELGPGRGPFMRACKLRGLDYTCADISWTALRNLSGVEKRVQTLVPPLPFASQAFDIAFASNVLEHMLDFRHALLLIEEMKRTVRPGGLICHRVPNAMAWGLHFWNGDYTHSFFTTPRTVSQVYLDAGLNILAIYPVSGFLVGALARPASLFGYLVPSWLFDHGANRSSLSQMLYSAKTTLFLGFLIIGQKK
ncbi:MAG: class I SAM-dependent methyltransferase [Anaerolineales bacterium]